MAPRWTTARGTRKAVPADAAAATAAGVDEEYGDYFPALILQVGRKDAVGGGDGDDVEEEEKDE